MVCPICNAKSSRLTGVRGPTGGARFTTWMEALQFPIEIQNKIYKQQYYICYSHFKEEHLIIENDSVVGVTKDAIPCLPDEVEERYSYFIVDRTQLELLFSFCYKCGTRIGRTLDLTVTGANVVFNYYCVGCGGAKGTRVWWSSHKMEHPGEGRRTSKGTMEAVSACCLSPISYNVCLSFNIWFLFLYRKWLHFAKSWDCPGSQRVNFTDLHDALCGRW